MIGKQLAITTSPVLHLYERKRNQLRRSVTDPYISDTFWSQILTDAYALSLRIKTIVKRHHDCHCSFVTVPDSVGMQHHRCSSKTRFKFVAPV